MSSPCSKCENLCNFAQNVCLPGRGNIHSGIFIIGQNPGADEDRVGIPFIGRAGAVLEDALVQAGLKKSFFGGEHDTYGKDVGPYITNIVKCHSPDNRPPTVEEINNCKEYLLKEIEEGKPKVIVALGNYAQYFFTGKVTGISRIRGLVEETEHGVVVYTYHPAAILYERSGSKVVDFSNDIKKAKDILENPDYKDHRLKYDYSIIHTIEDLKELVSVLETKKVFAIDIETNGLTTHRDDPKILCISIAFSDDFGYLIWLPSFEDESIVWETLRGVVENPDIKKVLANAKFDSLWIKEVGGLNPEGFTLDIILMHHLLYPFSKNHSLKYQADVYFQDGHYDNEIALELRKIQDKHKTLLKERHNLLLTIKKAKQRKDELEGLTGKRNENLYIKWSRDLVESARRLKEIQPDIEKNQEIVDSGYFGIPSDFLAPYAIKDAIYTWKIFKILLPKIREKGMVGIYKASSDFIKVLVDAESSGIAYDENVSSQISSKYADEIAKLEREFQELPSVQKAKEFARRETFNPKSTVQLRGLFKDVLKLESPKKTEKGAPSYDGSVLKEWSSSIEEARRILEIRHLTKMKSTYLDGIMEKVYRGRYYPEFNNIGTISGRMASGFHTIPKTPKDIGLRLPFVSSFSNGFLVEVDESQLELRVAAHVFEDKNMIEAFNQEVDIHTRTAAKVFNIPEEDVDRKKHRQIAKTLNFAILYGTSPWSLRDRLQEDTGTEYSVDEASSFITEWLNFYSEIRDGIQRIQDKLEFTPESEPIIVRTIFGRELDLSYSRSDPTAYTQRIAVNFPIQSVGSDLTIMGTYDVYRKIRQNKMNSRIVGVVHDSVILDVPGEEIYDIIPLAMDSFIHPPIHEYFPDVQFKTKLNAGVAVGHTLGEMTELEEKNAEVLKELGLDYSRLA